jgi:hypothetical protein
MSDRHQTEERGSRVVRQDATGVDVPAGASARDVPPEEVQPAMVTGDRDAAEGPSSGEDRSRGAHGRGEGGGRVVAAVHAEATPAASGGVRPVGNIDVPVNARDPDAE